MNTTDIQTWTVCTGNYYVRGLQIEATTSREAAEKAIPVINAHRYSRHKIATGETVTFTVLPSKEGWLGEWATHTVTA